MCKWEYVICLPVVFIGFLLGFYWNLCFLCRFLCRIFCCTGTDALFNMPNPSLYSFPPFSLVSRNLAKLVFTTIKTQERHPSPIASLAPPVLFKVPRLPRVAQTVSLVCLQIPLGRSKVKLAVPVNTKTNQEILNAKR
jgi:hypothetical protein